MSTSELAEAYVKKYAKDAIASEKKFGVDSVVTLAQGSLEGNFGTSYAVKTRNNHFGITAYGSKNPYWDGSYTVSSASGLKFRVYKTPRDSFMDFARLISASYKNCAGVSKDSNAYAKCIANSPYISEKNGDNRASYEKTVADRSKIIRPYLEKYKQKERQKKIWLMVSVCVISLLIISAVIILVKNNKKTTIKK